MIIHITLTLKQLFKEGKDFSWPRPSCRCGNEKPWGHGYAPSFFDGFAGHFWLKRYLCPVCGKVILLKPKGYLKRFQASIEVARSSVMGKYYSGKWLPGLSRSRQNHWYQALIRKARAYFGHLQGDLVEAFEKLLEKGLTPMSRTI